MKRVIKANDDTAQIFLRGNKVRKFDEEDRQAIYDNIERFEQEMSSELSARVDGVDVTVSCESSTTGKQLWVHVKFWYNNKCFDSPGSWLIKLDWFLDWNVLWKKVHKSKYYKDTVEQLDKSLSEAIIDAELSNVNLSQLFKELFSVDCNVKSYYTVTPNYTFFIFDLTDYMRSPVSNILLDTLVMGFTVERNADVVGLTPEEILKNAVSEYDPYEVLSILEGLINSIADILPEEISMRVATTGGNRHDVAFELWRTSANVPDFSDDLIVDRPVVHRVLWKDLDSEFHSIISKVESSIDALLSDQPVGFWEEKAAKEPNSAIAKYLLDNFGIKFDKDGKRIQP